MGKKTDSLKLADGILQKGFPAVDLVGRDEIVIIDTVEGNSLPFQKGLPLGHFVEIWGQQPIRKCRPSGILFIDMELWL